MARQHTKSINRSWPVRPILLAIACICLLVSAIMFIQPSHVPSHASQPAAAANTASTAISKSNVRDKVKFDFYTLLPKNQQAQVAAQTQQQSAGEFWVQVGVFEKESLAEKLQERLGLSGFAAEIQHAKHSKRYTVLLGPFAVQQAKKTQGALSQLHIQSILVQTSKST